MRPQFAFAFLSLVVVAITIASCVPHHRRAPAAATGAATSEEDGGPFRLLLVSPRGEVERPEDARIAVVFSRPVGARGVAGTVVRATDGGAIDGAWIWVGDDTAVFEPKAPLPDSTSYRVTVDTDVRARDGSGLRAADGVSSTFEFSTARPTLVATRYLGWDERARHARVELQYSLPIRPEVVKRTVRFEGKGPSGPETIAFELPDPSPQPTSLLVAELDPRATRLDELGVIAPGAKAKLPVKGLGPLRVELACQERRRPRTAEEETPASERREPGKCDLDRSQLLLRFSKPVRTKDLERHLVLTPKPTKEKLDLARDHGTSLDVLDLGSRAGIEPGRKYKLTVTAGVSATDDDRLASDQDLSLEIADRPPEIEWRDLPEPGMAVAESARSVLPLALRATNIPTLEMVRSPLDDGQLLDLLFGGTGAAERREAGSIAGRSADWVEALAGSWAERVTFAAAPNVAQSARFEIDAAHRAPGTSGVFAIATRASGARTPVPDELRVVALTDLGVTTKWSPHGGLVWVTRLSSATSVAGASVSIRRVWPKSAAHPMRTQEAFVTTTNAAGIALVPAEVSATFVRPAPRDMSSAGASGSPSAGPSSMGPSDIPEAIVLVRHESDRTFARLPDLAPPDPRAIGSLFTDRLLYRPGETITLKGFFRIPSARGLQTPFGRPVTFEVADADEHVWSSRTLALDAFGSFSAAVPIPKTIKLGSARIRARFGDATREPAARPRQRGQRPEGWDVHESVSIDEVRVPELKIDATLDRPRYLPGETAQLTLRGTYLLGAPLRNAPVRIRVARTRDSFAPRGLDGFSTTSPSVEPDADGVSDLEARLGADGQVTVPIKIPAHSAQPGRVRRLAVDVTAEDAARAFAVGGSVGKTIHPAELYLGIRGPDEVLPRRPLKVEVAAVTIDGERRAGVTTRIELRHQGKPKETDARLGDCTVVTTSEAASCEIRPGLPPDRNGGTFWLIATAADPAGRPIGAARTVAIAKPPEPGRPPPAKPGPRQAPSLTFEDACAARPASPAELEPLELASREATVPGDVLACLRGSGGPGLLAFEREGILRHEAIARLGPKGASVRLPLTADDHPNVEIALSEVVPRTSPLPRPGLEDRGAPASSFRQLSLSVDAPAKKLAVSIETPADARPGSEIEATIRVTGEGGRGVPAQVTFWAVDEGVLLLRPMRRPDPGSELSTWRSADVITEDSRSALFVEHTGYHRIKAPSVRQGATSVSPGDFVGRVAFRPLAFWYPNLIADSTGVVRVRAKLPDNLTTWKTFAVAATTRDEMGGAEGSFRTNKPLSVRPQFPRLLRTGDHVDVAAIVDHLTEQEASPRATVTMTASGALTGGGSASVDVAGDPPRLPLDASASGPGSVTFRAEAGAGLADEVTLTPVVKPALALETRVFATDVKGGAPPPGEIVARLDLARARPDVGGLEWRIATSPFVGLGVQLRDLLEYPYGCTEQLASRLVPLVRLRALARDLMVTLPPDVDDSVRTSLANLLAHQRADGGFGFWRESRASEPALTVLALDALITAKAHGFAVAPSAIDRATTYLTASSALDPPSRAMFEDLLATAGQPRPPELRILATAHELPLFAKALLAHAFARVDPAAAHRLLDEIAARAETSGAIATFADEPAVRATAGTRANLSSNARTTALALRAFVAIEPRHPLVPRLVRGLLALRKDGRWPNTQATAWALSALDEARPFVTESRGAGAVDVALGGASVGRVVFAGLPGGEIQSGTIPTARLLAAPEKELRVTTTPSLGTVSFEGVLQYAPIDLPQLASDHGFHVARTYRRLDRAGGVAAGTPTPQLPFEVGEYVAVDVVVASAKAHELVVLDDPIPSGFEPVNQTFANADRRPIASDPARALVTQRELRDDRIVTFFDELPAGVHLTRYLLRVSHAGRFVVPPAKVECMYAPEIAGRTAASWVSARAR